MITRHDDGKAVTLYGDGPLIDHAGYTVEVGCEDGSALFTVRVGLDSDSCRAIRADLTPAAVAELRDRCNAYLKDQ